MNEQNKTIADSQDKPFSAKVILDNISDAILVIDKDFHYISGNDALKKRFFNVFNVEMLVGQDIREYLPEKKRNFWEAHYKRGFSGEKYQFEYTYEQTDGIHFFEVSINPIFIGENEIYGITIVNRDVTQRKTTEQKLITTQTNFGDALTFSKMGNWGLDLNTFMLSLSKHKQLILEIDNETDESLLMPLNDYAQRFVCKEDMPTIGDNVNLLIENRDNIGYTVHFDYRCTTAKKNLKYFHLACEVRENAQVFGFTQDITARKLAEKKSDDVLSESQEKIEKNNALLHSVLNSPTQTIIFSLDNDYCYTSFNKNHFNTMQHIWGCKIEIGKNMLDYITNINDKEKAKNNFNKVLTGESFQITEEYGEYPNRFFYENAYHPIKDEEGNVTGLTVFLFDITSLKRTEEALIKSQKEVNSIFENSFDAVFLIEEETHKIIKCNRRAVTLFEADNKQTIIHILGYEHLIPEDINIPEMEEFINAGNIWEREVEYMSAKGRLFWGHLSIKKVTNVSVMNFFMVKIADITERKETEKKLVEKQKQLEAIIENTSDYIWLIDTDYRLLNANTAFTNNIFTVHNIKIQKGMSILDDIPTVSQEDRFWWQKWYDEALSGVAFVRENSFVVNHETFYWENSLHPVREGEDIKGVAILSRNITERKRKEEEIRRSEEQLKYAIAATKEGVWDWDIKNKKFINNKAWYDILRYEPHEITQTISDITKLMHDDDKPSVYAAIWATRKGETDSFECEYRVTTKKGEKFWVRDRGTVVEKGANGEAVRIVGTLENITERKLVEFELQSQQKFIKKVINAVPNLIFVKDSAGKFVLVNKAFAAYYGVNVSSLIGKTDVNILNDMEYLSYYNESDQQVLETGKPVFLPETQKVDEETGEISFYQTVKVLLTTGDGEKQILGVATNITERKKAEAEKVRLVESLMQNVQDLEQFTYMVSHNLRSPVARILGLVGLLDKANKDNPFNDFIFTTVVDEVSRLDAIIGDLNIILAVRGKNNEKREEIVLRDMCNAVLLSLGSDLQKCGGTIEIEIPNDLVIYTIKTYSYSIILNLLSNAIKYRNPENRLQISVKSAATSDGNYVCVSVSDNGLGIDLGQNKEKIFGLYRRFHSHVEGKGIGLHITKTQIERMGGKIEIESALNIGTTFHVYFPL